MLGCERYIPHIDIVIFTVVGVAKCDKTKADVSMEKS